MTLLTAIVAAVTEPLPIAVLVSGTGTNLQALLDSVHGHEARIVAVAANRDAVRFYEREGFAPEFVYLRDTRRTR